MVDVGLRRRMTNLLYGRDGRRGLDAAKFREWVAERSHVSRESGVMSVLGDAFASTMGINWAYAAELVNRGMKNGNGARA